MPGFIKTPKDEQKWNNAKKAADKNHSESEGDSYWAVVNSIYQKMNKAKEELEKARSKMSDEYDPNEDPYESDQEDTGVDREFDPDEEESAANDWLKENDPKHNKDEYEEYGDNEDEDTHQKGIQEDLGDDDIEESQTGNPTETRKRDIPKASIKEDDSPEEIEGKRSRFQQPDRESLMSMRQYTRPWEQRARETSALRADPSKNPELARHGNIIEARNQSHGDRTTAYRQFTNSSEYKNADPISQMEMDDNFEKDWKSKNPEHLKSALQAHHSAHKKGEMNRELHAAGKHAAISNIISGGHGGGETYSLEEGMQHAGGIKGEEGTQASIKQDPASSFAMGNQDFIKEYAKNYANKNKKVKNIDDMMDHDEGSKRDITRILGEGPNKDPNFEKFFAHYHPLIGMSANRTISKLGLDPKHPDIDMSMLHEAGMHGLIQAMNDYDHDNPSKASFATHASNKIRGLQMTAMKNQDIIPSEVRQAQKQFTAQKKAVEQPKPKVDMHTMISSSGHPAASDIADRLKRVGAAKATVAIRRTGAEAQPKKLSAPITIPSVENNEEE